MVQIKLFDRSGKEVACLVNAPISAGAYTFEFDTSFLEDGIYLISFNADNAVLTRKIAIAD